MTIMNGDTGSSAAKDGSNAMAAAVTKTRNRTINTPTNRARFFPLAFRAGQGYLRVAYTKPIRVKQFQRPCSSSRAGFTLPREKTKSPARSAAKTEKIMYSPIPISG